MRQAQRPTRGHTLLSWQERRTTRSANLPRLIGRHALSVALRGSRSASVLKASFVAARHGFALLTQALPQRPAKTRAPRLTHRYGLAGSAKRDDDELRRVPQPPAVAAPAPPHRLLQFDQTPPDLPPAHGGAPSSTTTLPPAIRLYRCAPGIVAHPRLPRGSTNGTWAESNPHKRLIRRVRIPRVAARDIRDTPWPRPRGGGGAPARGCQNNHAPQARFRPSLAPPGAQATAPHPR